MEEQTDKSKTNYTPLLFIGGIFLIAVFGFGLLKPKEVEKSKEVVTQEQTMPSLAPEVSESPTTQPKVLAADLEKHSSKDDCWVMVNGKVYDVTKVIPYHKGGDKVIIGLCGKDASEIFNNRGGKGPHPSTAIANLEKLVMGLFEVKN